MPQKKPKQTKKSMISLHLKMIWAFYNDRNRKLQNFTKIHPCILLRKIMYNYYVSIVHLMFDPFKEILNTHCVGQGLNSWWLCHQTHKQMFLSAWLLFCKTSVCREDGDSKLTCLPAHGCCGFLSYTYWIFLSSFLTATASVETSWHLMVTAISYCVLW